MSPSEHYVLAVHDKARVRGAIHRSFAQMPEFDLTVAKDQIEAEGILHTREARGLPEISVVLMPLQAPTLEWALDLRARHVAPVVFCFTQSAAGTLWASAYDAGLRHFVEIPGDWPAAWATNSPRMTQTLQRAISEHRSRSKVFARQTRVQPVYQVDLVRARDGVGESQASRDRHTRTTLVKAVTPDSLREDVTRVEEPDSAELLQAQSAGDDAAKQAPSASRKRSSKSKKRKRRKSR